MLREPYGSLHRGRLREQPDPGGLVMGGDGARRCLHSREQVLGGPIQRHDSSSIAHASPARSMIEHVLVLRRRSCPAPVGQEDLDGLVHREHHLRHRAGHRLRLRRVRDRRRTFRAEPLRPLRLEQGRLQPQPQARLVADGTARDRRVRGVLSQRPRSLRTRAAGAGRHLVAALRQPWLVLPALHPAGAGQDAAVSMSRWSRRACS